VNAAAIWACPKGDASGLKVGAAGMGVARKQGRGLARAARGRLATLR
jgi:hypothetical protein